MPNLGDKGVPEWQTLLPSCVGSLPGGGELRRTEPSGTMPAFVAILGVYPALTDKRIFTVDGVRLTLPTEVEGRSVEVGSASGAKIDDNYLNPLGLTRADVVITDMMPYYLANTTKSSSGRSMADNVAFYEGVTGEKTRIQPRPAPAQLVELATELPGNLDRLRDYLGACRPRLVLTLGTEAAAFVRGISFHDAKRKVDGLLYADDERRSFLGIDAAVVHLVHPHLFIKRNVKWMNRHRVWCATRGRALVGRLGR